MRNGSKAKLTTWFQSNNTSVDSLHTIVWDPFDRDSILVAPNGSAVQPVRVSSGCSATRTTMNFKPWTLAIAGLKTPMTFQPAFDGGISPGPSSSELDSRDIIGRA